MLSICIECLFAFYPCMTNYICGVFIGNHPLPLQLEWRADGHVCYRNLIQTSWGHDVMTSWGHDPVRIHQYVNRSLSISYSRVKSACNVLWRRWFNHFNLRYNRANSFEYAFRFNQDGRNSNYTCTGWAGVHVGTFTYVYSHVRRRTSSCRAIKYTYQINGYNVGQNFVQ